MKANEAETPVLEVIDLVKNYGPVQVLKSMSLAVNRGEVRALMGVNGAGKSTLVNILGGIVPVTSGMMRIDGEELSISTPIEAQAAGIAIVHQELSLVPGLTVAENITLGRWATRRAFGIRSIDATQLKSDARQALELLGEDIGLNTLVEDLSPASQQLVEIAKALVGRPKILILDEPTSSLATHEVDALIGLVRRLADQGVTILYVSHRMDEIPRVADSVTVLRDGREVETKPADQMDTATIAALMLGKELAVRPEMDLAPTGEPVLEVEGLERPGVINDVSFTVKAGEVLGIVGLMGSGRTEILRAIFGVDPAEGTVKVHGKTIDKRTPGRMIAAGVGFTPEERKDQGLVLEMSVSNNLALTCFERIRSSFGSLSTKQERMLAAESIRKQSIATSSPDLEVGRLSGGNQQKVVIGKWLNKGVSVLLMDEPTRGVDVHSKAQTYDTIIDLAREGRGIVFVSSEVEEVFLVCHRILIIRGGRIVADLATAETDSEHVLALSMKELESAA